jgi:predicted RNA-binding protein with PIN domain
MPLIIDGYNLLHVTGITGRRGDLQGSREALLRFLADAIDAKERPLTTVVFDAADAPPGLPRIVSFEQMTVHYASNYDDADELIEELIAANHVPRSLLVVSSDHRIQRAARRRRAAFTDSDIWFADMERRRQHRQPAPRTSKPQGPLSAEEIGYWLAEFTTPIDVSTSSKADEATSVENPFPPGYGEDVLEEEA